MQKLEFIVQIPAVLSAISGFETKKFDGENPQKNKRKALKYLSEVIIGCVEKKSIEISEINPNANLRLIKNLRQENYLNKNGILDFPKIFRCKINYTFSEEIMRDLLRTTRDGDKRNEIVDFLGVIKLLICEGRYAFPIEILSVDNNWNPLRTTQNLKKLHHTEILIAEELITPSLFNYIFEKKQLEEIFYCKEFYSKMIFKDENFLAFEKEFLSLMNIPLCEFQIFIPQNQFITFQNTISTLMKTYDINAEMSEKKYLKFGKDTYCCFIVRKENKQKLIYSKDHKLFYRNDSGLQEADEKTKIEEIINFSSDPVSPPVVRIR
jgi:hypothetical protein